MFSESNSTRLTVRSSALPSVELSPGDGVFLSLGDGVTEESVDVEIEGGRSSSSNVTATTSSRNTFSSPLSKAELLVFDVKRESKPAAVFKK